MPDASTTFELRVALVPTVRSSRDGADVRVDGPWLWRASRTPEGPATTRISAEAGVVTVDAWGPGADAAVAAAPDLLGAHDDPESFRPEHPRLRAVVAELRWVRMARAGDLVSCLLRAVCGQRVTWRDAEIAWRGLLRRWGTEAPGPAPEGLRVPPDPAVLRHVPLHELHTVEMEAQRGRAEADAATSDQRVRRTPSTVTSAIHPPAILRTAMSRWVVVVGRLRQPA